MAEETKASAEDGKGPPVVAPEATTAQIVVALENRIVELENAFHGLLTHEGALHKDVVGWFAKFRAKLAGVIAPKPEKGGDSGSPAA